MENKYFERISKLPQFRGSIQSRNQARQLPTGLKVGDIFYIENDDKFQIVIEKNKHDLSFTDLDMNATISTGITVYDLNKSIVSKELLFDWDNQEKKYNLEMGMLQWLSQHDDNFFLLYSKELNYFTLFIKSGTQINIDEVFECIKNAGDFISADYSDDRVEIWVRTETNPAALMYLLPFENGIVKI